MVLKIRSRQNKNCLDVIKTCCLSLLAIVLLQSLLSVKARAAGADEDRSAKTAAPNATTDAKKKKSTSIDFEDQLIEGQSQKPELFYLMNQKQFNFKRLIRLREDFLPEMRKSADEIQRQGSGN